MPFDLEGAKKAGYSDAEIASYLAQQSKFDADGARKAGYSDSEIIGHLVNAQTATAKGEPAKPKDAGGASILDKAAAFPQWLGKQVINAPAGALRGAGSIGATLMWPIDKIRDVLSDKQGQSSNEERRQEMTAALGGMGFDPSSLGFQAGKLGGEIAGTAGVGGLLAGALSKVPGVANAVPGLLNSIRSAGMTTGASPTGLLGRTGDMLLRSAGGAINGGAAGLMIDPASAKAGAVVGGLLPPSISLAAQAGQTLGRTVLPVFSSGAATKTAATRIADAAGRDNVPQMIGDLQTYYPKGAEAIPVSSAGITGNAGVGRLEQGSRVRTPENWLDFDRSQAKAVFDNVLQATDEAGQLAARKADRAQNWTASWGNAENSFKPRNFKSLMGQLKSSLDQAAQSPESSNPAVLNVLKAIDGEVVRMGDQFNIGNLQQIRANLSGRANAMSTDPFKSAPRDNPAVISIISELDDILNKSTGGRWQRVVEGYAKDSDAVRAAAAASKVRSAYLDEATGRVLGRTIDPAGEVPVITEAGLSRAMNAARLPDKSLALSQPAEERLGATLDALRRQSLVQSLKRTATAGGGSDTVANLGAAGLMPRGNRVLELIDAIGKLGTYRTDKAMAGLLSNPDELALQLSLLGRRPAMSGLLGPAYQAAPAIAADR